MTVTALCGQTQDLVFAFTGLLKGNVVGVGELPGVCESNEVGDTYYETTTKNYYTWDGTQFNNVGKLYSVVGVDTFYQPTTDNLALAVLGKYQAGDGHTLVLPDLATIDGQFIELYAKSLNWDAANIDFFTPDGATVGANQMLTAFSPFIRLVADTQASNWIISGESLEQARFGTFPSFEDLQNYGAPTAFTEISITSGSGKGRWIYRDATFATNPFNVAGIAFVPVGDTSGKQWERVFTGAVKASWFGILPDGVDCGDKINFLFSTCKDYYFDKVGIYYSSVDLVLPHANEITLKGVGLRKTRITLGADAALTNNGTVGTYSIFRLRIKDITIEPSANVARNRPMIETTGIAYIDADRMLVQGESLTNQADRAKNTWDIQFCLGLNFNHVDVQGGVFGLNMGKAGYPVNVINLNMCNINGSRRGIVGAVTSFNLLGGTVQSCGYGIDLSSSINESSSTVNIVGTYFENNKYHDGTKFIGRDIVLGEQGVVRGTSIKAYFASLSDDNKFTNGQGKSDISPILIKKAQGFSLDHSSMFTGYALPTNDGVVEIMHGTSNGYYYPRDVVISGFTSISTKRYKAIKWNINTTEAQKEQITRKENLITKDWDGSTKGITKEAISPLISFKVGATGLVDVPLLAPEDLGFIESVELLITDGFVVNALFSVGNINSSNFNVSAVQLGTKSSPSIEQMTLNSKSIKAVNGLVFARLNITSVMNGGSFSVRVKYKGCS